MKKSIKNFLVFLISIFALIPLSIKADEVDNAIYGSEPLITTNEYLLTPSLISEYDDYDYVIDKYDVNIVVNEDNTYDITETITAFFNISKHGIYRTIPLTNNIVRNDGTSNKNKAQVTNVSVDKTYTTSKVDGNFKITIGDANKTLTGEQTYTIKYTYNIGKDTLEDADELYYNIIGSGWDTVIGNITFTITMPKDFDESKLGFSSGEVGSITGSEKVVYEVKDNVITGSYNDVIKAGEALTVRCELEEGYFVDAGFNIKDYILYIIPIVFAAISLLLWFKYGRDDEVIETVEFYPPKGFNSLEVGFLYKGKADDKDVTSLLIYLANKGYIKISEHENKVLFTKTKSFKITKLKEYDGENVEERIFLNGLFSPKASFKLLFSKGEEKEIAEEKDEVTQEDLVNNFYITLNRILDNINTKENKNTIFDKSSSSKKIFIILMIIASFLAITIPPVLIYSDADMLIPLLIFPGIGFTVLSIAIINDLPTNARIFMLVWGLGFGGMPWLIMMLPILLQDTIYLICYFIGALCIVIMIISAKNVVKRTPYGTEMLGKIRGFKNFLETAEKEKLEAMVNQNPEYFYEILPYTYVLGVSNKWIKKFETISMQSPDWYDSPTAFDVASFGSFINTTMASANTAMSSSPSSDGGGSSGGGSSGGGSSGGGSGGGGGGSW